MTLYDRVGDLVAWVAIAALVVAIVLARGSDSKGTGLQRRMAGDQADRFS